jgi:hypothetical protein
VSDNPFERYDLDALRDDVPAITSRLRELIEDAPDEAERERLRAAWEELTLHPERRFRAALQAHPETRAPLGSPPPRKRVSAAKEPALLDRFELYARPSLMMALPKVPSLDELRIAADAPVSLDDDPLL